MRLKLKISQRNIAPLYGGQAPICRDAGDNIRRAERFDQLIYKGAQSSMLGKRPVGALPCLPVLPRPIFNDVKAAGTKKWKEGFKTRQRRFVNMAGIVNNKIERSGKLNSNYLA